MECHPNKFNLRKERKKIGNDAATWKEEPPESFMS